MMSPPKAVLPNRAILIALTLAFVVMLVSIQSASAASLDSSVKQAAPTAVITTTDELVATQDAYIRSSSPDNGFGNGFTRIGQPTDQTGLIQFDLSVLPVNATIDRAELQLTYTGAFTGSSNIEIGANTDPWEENNVTYNTKPNMVFGGPVQTVEDAPGVIRWTVTRLVDQWQSGAVTNYGFALRGDGPHKVFHAKETNANFAPRLRIIYSTPVVADEPRPDLGDAPDSSNHHNQPNTAYLGAGILGQFPTVYDVPANAVAGPRHDNLILEGYLGNVLSREVEADQDADQDGPNNIIRDAAGTIADVADMDRGDDGWRNRNIRFFDCQKQTLKVRVSKAAVAATVEDPKRRMYLNVWFDGNRDGDWGDISLCENPSGGPGEASYEWIVQDYLVDMNAIAAGDFFDFDIETERVFNAGQQLPHWMRFTLSDTRAVLPDNGGNPDGRGPHPESDQMSYRLGETEDVLYTPSPPGDDGELLIEKRVITDGEPVPYAGSVTYEIRVRHDGGTQPIEARIRDELPYPLHINRQLDADGNVYLIEVRNPTGGASPLSAEIEYDFGDSATSVTQVVNWEGTLEPDSEVILSFEVHIHPICDLSENTTTITNLAQAQIRSEAAISAVATFEAACGGYTPSSIEIGKPTLTQPNPEDWSLLDWRGEVHNQHDQDIALGFVQQIGESSVSAAGTEMASESRFLQRVELAPDEKRDISLQMVMDESLDGDLDSEDDEPLGQLRYCIMVGEGDACPDPSEYPDMWGDIELPLVPRRADLGDAPDSTNHDGVAMAAYPSIQANFPTVFDPATGLPPGPRHLRPWLLHLGPDVSNEVEADIGPDADGINNILPISNTADLDWYDDGSALTLQGFCQPALADVEVTISAQAHQKLSGKDVYLNIWLDWSHDGDWEDTFSCTGPGGQSADVFEHILVDYTIDVASLAVGSNLLTNILTEPVPWPATLNDKKRWVRFTLSERPSNKASGSSGDDQEESEVGDGRGYLIPFRTGETEDYLWDLRDNPKEVVEGPDMVIQADAEVHVDRSPSESGDEPTKQLVLKANYANVGSAPATDAVLIVTRSTQISGAEVQGIAGAGVGSDSVTYDGFDINVSLPTIPAGESRSVLLQLGPINDTLLAAAANTTAVLGQIEFRMRIETTGELNQKNNVAKGQIESILLKSQQLAGIAEGDTLWRKADTTCKDSITLASRGEPNAPFRLLLNGVESLQDVYSNAGLFQAAEITNLGEGRNLFLVDYEGNGTALGKSLQSQSVQLNVEPSLAVDPITLLLTDSQGRQFHPSTLNWSSGSLSDYVLQSGESYEISINSCGDGLSATPTLLYGGERLTTLRDDDGDGHYSGRFIYQSGQTDNGTSGGEVQAANAENDELRLVINANGVEESFVGQVRARPTAMVLDASTDQPVAGASVTVLLDGAEATLHGANPQVTDADGLYSIDVSDDSYQLLVTADGYQPYRSKTIDVSGGILAQDVQLAAAVDIAADHTIFITAQGYSPAAVDAKPGDVIEWINTDLYEHVASGDAWHSGHLAPLESFKIQLNEEGVYAYSDDSDQSFGTGAISVKNESPDPTGGENPDDGDNPNGTEGAEIFLPVVQQK